MGRNTHLAADKPHRRRIVFSTTTSGWQRPTQLWLDPAQHTPDALATLVADVHPLENGLILGGTRVHDWFLAHRAIHKVHLTVEPVIFGEGLPIFTDAHRGAPLAIFVDRGFSIISEQRVNRRGTRYYELTPDAV